MGELYYCDIVIGERYIIEINGEQHYNVFFKNGEVLEENFKYLGNFELKKAILYKKGYNVLPIDEDSYKHIIGNRQELENFLTEFLIKMFKN